jgi:hypothetical protein
LIRGLLLLAVVLIPACDNGGAPHRGERQQPSSQTQGLVISGSVDIGVVKEF